MKLTRRVRRHFFLLRGGGSQKGELHVGSNGVIISPNEIYEDIKEIKSMIADVKTKLAVQESKDTQVDQRLTQAEVRLDRLEQKIEERQYQKGFQTTLIAITALLGAITTIGGIVLTWLLTK